MSAPKDPKAPLHSTSPSLLRVTFPIVKESLRSRRLILVGLALISLLLGIVPTIKSEIESAVIGTISDQLRSGSGWDSFREPMARFTQDGAAGFPEKLASMLFSGLTMGVGIFFYFVIGLLAFGLEIGSASATAKIGKDLFRRLRSAGFKRALETDATQIQSLSNAPGQYATAIHQGATNAQNTYEYLLDFARQMVSVATIVFLLATKNIWFSVGCVVLVAGQALISLTQATRLHTARESLDKRRNDLVARTDDILSKRDIIVVHEQQDSYGHKLDTYTSEYAEIGRHLDVSEAVFRHLSQLVTDYGRIAVLILALCVAIMGGSKAIANIGDAYFIVSMYFRLFIPVSNVLTRYDSIRRSEATSRTYLEIMSQPEPSPPPKNSMRGDLPLMQPPAIAFEDVTFGYTGRAGQSVLEHCSFSVPAGSITLILGPSGCGKTSAMRLLLGFWKPDGGRILLNGRDLTEFSPADLRLHASYVAQGDYIVDDTVRENLSWSSVKRNDDELVQVLIDLKVTSSPDAPGTLNKPARNLSIGQQQRLSLCRLLLDDAPLLIIDEPLSGVDGFTIRDVLPHVVNAIKASNKTVILISHRVSFVRHASHVVVMGSTGSVMEEGPPQHLLEKRSSYLSQLHEVALDELGFATRRV